MARVHLDCNAGTRIDPAGYYGNASSGHAGPGTTQDEIDAVADRLASILAPAA